MVRRRRSRSRGRSRSRIRSRSRHGRRKVPKMKSAVLAAVLSFKSKRGVTSATVARRIKGKYGTGNLPKNFRGSVGRALRGLARAGKLERVRGRFRITGGARHGRSRRRGSSRRRRRPRSRRRRSRGGRRRSRSRSRGGKRRRRRRRRRRH